MEIFRLYESIIHEDGRNSGIQACVSKYGKELFDTQFGGEEPNTELEDDTAANIEDFTGQKFGKNLSQEFLKQISDLKKCLSVYPEILMPEGNAYRGIYSELGRILPSISKQDISDWFKYEYAARTKIQSWSASEEVGQDFADAALDGYSYNLVNRIHELLDEKDPEETVAINFIKTLNKEELLTKFRIPILMRHVASSDQFLFKAVYFSMLARDDEENELLRIDNRPLVVDAKIGSEYSEVLVRILPLIAKVIK